LNTRPSEKYKKDPEDRAIDQSVKLVPDDGKNFQIKFEAEIKRIHP